MRSTLLIPAALVSMGLAAQPPENLVQKYNNAFPGILKAMQDLDYGGACAKADALVPAQDPLFDAKDMQTISQSTDTGRGMLALLKLQGNTHWNFGHWEQAIEIHEHRLKYAEALQRDTEKALQVQEGLRKQQEEEATAYLAKHEKRVEELQKLLTTLNTDIKAFNDNPEKLDAKQRGDLKTRAEEGPKLQAEYKEIAPKVASSRAIVKQWAKYPTWAAGRRKMLEDQLTEARTALEKAQADLKAQQTMIANFGAGQGGRKAKAPQTGPKAWVAAVLREHGNITKLATPQDRVSVLNRLLVLDPENPTITQALTRLRAGLEPFPEEKGVKGKKK